MRTDREGSCRCGSIRFRINADPLVTAVCHCRGCQKMTASAFSTTITLPADALEVIAGEPVIGGLHGDEARHHHCGWCKSWLFTRLPPEYGAVNVRATMLDDARGFTPFMETFTSEALPWAKTGATRSFERFPEPGDYPALIEAYRESVA
ncbi:GFA family protein [Sphingomonas turrisvirgatae]|uniref:Aldehyde-activating protein n=1 Tax=Sphingomonas turrisvirgatae TaxID=1888892 RepID=A0A1E3LYR6_9SPHN|nr:GFA family protein [Sphingomonas turrisvirgatae]ODP38245.1 aldehyde-activating protein [Sphingomonas turrisvirgatae]